MDGDTPNPALFEQHVGTLIDQILQGRQSTIVRAYGEMVDVLWKDGHAEAAMALELLWNKLALKHSFALMCGYAMGSFYKRSEQMHDVRAVHSHVIESDSNVLPFEARRTARSA